MSTDVWSYEGRHAVVTGCASGIGAATVGEVRVLGARVTGLDINEPTAEMDTFIRVDMADKSSIEEAAARIDRPIDALFNCAGLSGGGGPAPLVMRVNFIGLRHLTELLVADMQPGSAIANVASVGGQGYESNMDAVREFLAISDFDHAVRWCDAHPEQFLRGGYAFSKQSLIVYTMIRALDLARRGVRINCIGPGMTNTPMLLDSAKALGKEYLDRFPRPLGRDAEPEEQARVLIFLNGHAASHVSGQHLWTDAGVVTGLTVGTIDRAALAR